MIRRDSNGLAWYTFASLPEEDVLHGAFTRLGGASLPPFAALNVGGHVGDDPVAVAANHRALCGVLGCEQTSIVSARQVHGDRVAVVDERHRGQTLADTDALVTRSPDALLLLRFADCVPVFLYDPKQQAVALAHAGWKGTLLEIARKTVEAMVHAFGTTPAELITGLGPAIGPCCFEVGADVLNPLRQLYGARAEALIHHQPKGTDHIDLWLANRWQLEAAGVTQIEWGAPCTCCHRDEFYSHRGENGRTGRFAAVLGLRGVQRAG